MSRFSLCLWPSSYPLVFTSLNAPPSTKGYNPRPSSPHIHLCRQQAAAGNYCSLVVVHKLGWVTTFSGFWFDKEVGIFDSLSAPPEFVHPLSSSSRFTFLFHSSCWLLSWVVLASAFLVALWTLVGFHDWVYHWLCSVIVLSMSHLIPPFST